MSLRARIPSARTARLVLLVLTLAGLIVAVVSDSRDQREPAHGPSSSTTSLPGWTDATLDAVRAPSRRDVDTDLPISPPFDTLTVGATHGSEAVAELRDRGYAVLTYEVCDSPIRPGRLVAVRDSSTREVILDSDGLTRRANEITPSAVVDVLVSCEVQPPRPPGLIPVSEQQGTLGANTFTNPYRASGIGPRIEPGSQVEVTCKVFAPQIQSANPDGYWYRIASSPWNDRYYAAANTFWNGDVPGQTPYTENTDFAVPDC